jgi:hypothetical protein
MVWTKINGKENDDSSHLGCNATSTGSSNPLICTNTARKTSNLTELIQMPSNYNYYTEIPTIPTEIHH